MLFALASVVAGRCRSAIHQIFAQRPDHDRQHRVQLWHAAILRTDEWPTVLA